MSRKQAAKPAAKQLAGRAQGDKRAGLRAGARGAAADARRAGSAPGARRAGRPAQERPRGLRPSRPVSAAHDRSAIGTVVAALGYELVDIERESRGLLRVTIDRLPDVSYPSGPGEAVTVDDCEYVTRQLQYALEVGGVPYERLEVSSPGLDRVLRTEAHYERFTGALVALELKAPLQGRRAFKGVLGRGEAGGWTLVFDDGKGAQVLGFELDEVREARLVPVLDFKGRRQSKGQGAGEVAAPTPQDGGQDR